MLRRTLTTAVASGVATGAARRVGAWAPAPAMVAAAAARRPILSARGALGARAMSSAQPAAPAPASAPDADKKKAGGAPATGGAADLAPNPKLEALLDQITKLNLVELAQLVELLKRSFGFPAGMSFVPMGGAAAPGAGPAAGPGAGAGAGAGAGGKADAKEAKPAAAAEKTVFDVKLDGFEASDKIKIIKEVRAITGLGLKEAKDLVEGVPKVVGAQLAKADAEAMAEKLKAAGGKVTLV